MLSQTLILSVLALQAKADWGSLPGHPWVAPGAGDVRSPCPGLNVLANHGFLPHSGRNLTKTDLTSAIKLVYNFDDQMADFFAEGGLTVNGPRQASLNLDELDKHDSIEHDASLSRMNFAQGNNHDIQPAMVQAIIDDAKPKTVLSVQSLAKSRNRRDKESQSPEGKGKPLPVKLRTFAYGESALILQVLGELSEDPSGDLLPPAEAIQSWIGQEKLPDNYHVPRDQVTVFRTTGLMSKVAAAANLPFGGGLLSILFKRHAEAGMEGRGMWPLHGGI